MAKIKIEFDSLFDAACTIGCENDFSEKGWSYLETYEFELEDCTMTSSAVENMTCYYSERTIEDYIGDNHLDTPEDVDFSEITLEDIRSFLYSDCCLDGIVGVYMDDDGEIQVLTCGDCSYPEQDDWSSFLHSKGYTKTPNRDDWEGDFLWALEESYKGKCPIWYDFTDNEFMLEARLGHDCAVILDGVPFPEGELTERAIGDWALDYVNEHGDALWHELVEKGFEEYTAAHPHTC